MRTGPDEQLPWFKSKMKNIWNTRITDRRFLVNLFQGKQYLDRSKGVLR